jgi:hypothetical protein
MSMSRSAIPNRSISTVRPRRNKGSNSREKLFEGERLDEVIVGTTVQTGDTIFEGIPSRQEQHRRFESTFADCRQNLKPIPAGEHQGREE